MFELRPATEEDYAFLWRVASTTMRDYVHAIWGWDEAWQEPRFRSHFVAGAWRIIVVEGQDAGGLQASLGPSDATLFLANIYLLPEFQNRGIGSAVVQGLVAEAEAKNVPLRLDVLKSNPDALRLYERLGLRVIGDNAERYFMSTEKDQP
ncbi:MAG: GNAT family N-acetyltransferase [Janthinobacterium lividum]